MIFFFFYEMLDEIGEFKRIQHFVQHRKFHMLDEMFDLFKSALATDGFQVMFNANSFRPPSRLSIV